MCLRSVVLSAALLILPLPLIADTVTTFTLNNVTFADGATATGTITIDVTTGVPTGVDMVYSDGAVTDDFITAPSYFSNGPTSTINSFDPANEYLNFSFPVSTLVGYTGGNICSDEPICSIGSAFVDFRIINSLKTGSLDPPSSSTPSAPEPSTLALLGTGILGLAGAVRRRLPRQRRAVPTMSRTQRINSLAVIALAMVALVSKPAAATTIDINGVGSTALNTFFTGQGYTVNQLGFSFTSLAGANFVILLDPSAGISADELSAIDAYVNGGGRLLLNTEYVPLGTPIIASANTILASLGSSIVNQSTASDPGYHDTSDIVANPFTTGVTDVNYAATSSLTGGTALVYGNPITDDGQEFISYQAIGAGYVFVIADENPADNINSTTTNNNGVLYCNFGGLSCAATAPPVPEPGTLVLFGTGLLGAGAVVWRRFFA